MDVKQKVWIDRDGSVLMRVWRNDGFYGSRYRPKLTRILAVGADKAALLYERLIQATAPPQYK